MNMENDHPLSAQGLFIWSLCVLFFLYDFFIRTVLGSFQTNLIVDLQLTKMQFSLLSTTCFAVIYGIMQIPAGLSLEKFGLKTSLTCSAALCALSTLGFAFSQTFSEAIFWRIFMGGSASFGFLGTLCATTQWLPKKHLALFIGLSQFIGTMGPMLAAGPLEHYIVQHGLSWRSLFFSLSAIASSIAVLFILFLKNKSQYSGQFLILHRKTPLKSSLKEILNSRQVWIIAITSACLYCSIEYLSENEGRDFLLLKGLSALHASYLITLSWFSYALAAPLLGFLSDLLERRTVFIQITAYCGLLSLLLFFFSEDYLALCLSFILLGICGAGQSLGFAAMAENVTKSSINIGFAINNTMLTMIAGLNAPLIGLFLDKQSALHALEKSDYLLGFSLLFLISAIALGAALLIKETFCKNQKEPTYLSSPSSK